MAQAANNSSLEVSIVEGAVSGGENDEQSNGDYAVRLSFDAEGDASADGRVVKQMPAALERNEADYVVDKNFRLPKNAESAFAKVQLGAFVRVLSGSKKDWSCTATLRLDTARQVVQVSRSSGHDDNDAITRLIPAQNMSMPNGSSAAAASCAIRGIVLHTLARVPAQLGASAVFRIAKESPVFIEFELSSDACSALRLCIAPAIRFGGEMGDLVFEAAGAGGGTPDAPAVHELFRATFNRTKTLRHILETVERTAKSVVVSVSEKSINMEGMDSDRVAYIVCHLDATDDVLFSNVKLKASPAFCCGLDVQKLIKSIKWADFDLNAEANMQIVRAAGSAGASSKKSGGARASRWSEIRFTFVVKTTRSSGNDTGAARNEPLTQTIGVRLTDANDTLVTIEPRRSATVRLKTSAIYAVFKRDKKDADEHVTMQVLRSGSGDDATLSFIVLPGSCRSSRKLKPRSAQLNEQDGSQRSSLTIEINTAAAAAGGANSDSGDKGGRGDDGDDHITDIGSPVVESEAFPRAYIKRALRVPQEFSSYTELTLRSGLPLKIAHSVMNSSTSAISVYIAPFSPSSDDGNDADGDDSDRDEGDEHGADVVDIDADDDE